jgi:hypothetical protein
MTTAKETIMTVSALMDCSPAYAAWFGKPVVLVVSFRQQQIPMPCSIVSESPSDLRVCINPGCEMDLPKQLVLAVEEDAAGLSTHCAPISLIN